MKVKVLNYKLIFDNKIRSIARQHCFLAVMDIKYVAGNIVLLLASYI